MSDYIKREDAIRQIVKTSAQNELDIPAIGTVIYILFEMDSADVVEVVRCKDCAKRECCRTSTVWAVPPNDDWYCADAERRTDE